MSLITTTTRQTLTTLYNAPTRHYHSTGHITALLSLLSTHRSLFTDPPAVEAAIWFHDAIYDVHAPAAQNEIQSAALAVQTLQGVVDPDRLERIRVMIEATATHTPPTAAELRVDEGAGEVEDARLFLDMDLSVLGAGEEEFDAYEEGVRREYGHVSEEGWREGRRKVLRGFLGREKIYFTGLFGGLLEERARGNLKRSIARLEGSP